MRKYIIAAGLLVCIFGNRLFSGTDVGKLLPVQLLSVSRSGEEILVQTDTGNVGRGKTLEDAFRNLKDGAEGVLFLDTADQVLVPPEDRELLEPLCNYLRPSCRVCYEGAVNLPAAAVYLQTHTLKTSLAALRAGEEVEEILTQTQEGAMHIEKQT